MDLFFILFFNQGCCYQFRDPAGAGTPVPQFVPPSFPVDISLWVPTQTHFNLGSSQSSVLSAQNKLTHHFGQALVLFFCCRVQDPALPLPPWWKQVPPPASPSRTCCDFPQIKAFSSQGLIASFVSRGGQVWCPGQRGRDQPSTEAHAQQHAF